MGSVIDAALKHITKEEDREAFYAEVIPAFEDCDWDTQDEAMGIDPVFDTTMKKLHPTWEWGEEEP